MPSIGLVGGGFVGQSTFVDDQRIVNLFPEIVPSGRGRSRVTLYRTPGIKSRITGLDGAGRGALSLNNHVFAVMGSYVYDIVDGWNIIATYGPIANDSKPVSLAANPDQLFIISAGLGYIIEAGVLTPIADPDFPADAKIAGYVNGYFLAMTSNLNAVGHSNALYFSAVSDGTSWDALDFIEVLSSANSLVSMFVDHQQILLAGTQVTVPLQLAGGLIPFVPIDGAALDCGFAATYGFTKADNTHYFIGSDEDGGAMAYKLVGYTRVRVSNHDLDAAMQRYGDISDCVGSSFQINGHTFIQFSFPSVTDNVGNVVGATWRMDAAAPGMWHEALHWDIGIAGYQEHLCRYHAYAFNKHVGLSRSTGTIYEMSQSFRNDDGAFIRRLRQCPHIFDVDGGYMYYSDLRVFMPTGTSTDSTLNPKVMLDWSDDWGQTWSGTLMRSAGVTGDYKRQVRFNRLGKTNSPRVFRLTMTDDYDWVLVDAQCNFHKGR